jgi:hypothetical protein
VLDHLLAGLNLGHCAGHIFGGGRNHSLCTGAATARQRMGSAHVLSAAQAGIAQETVQEPSTALRTMPMAYACASGMLAEAGPAMFCMPCHTCHSNLIKNIPSCWKFIQMIIP